MKPTNVIICVLVGAGIMFLLMRSCEDVPTVDPEKIAQEIVKEKIHAEEKRVRQAAIDSMNTMHKADVKRWNKKDSTLTAENKRLKKKLTPVATIQHAQLIDISGSQPIRVISYTPPGASWPLIGYDSGEDSIFGTAIWDRDSIIAVQDSLLTLRQHRLDSTTLVKDGIIDTLRVSLDAETTRSEYWHGQTLEAREGLKTSPVSFGISTGPGLMVSNDGAHAGWFFGPSITYEIKLRNPFKRRR